MKIAIQIGTNDSRTNDTFKDICEERGIEYAYLIEPLDMYNDDIEEHYKDLPHSTHNIAITPDPEAKEAVLYVLGNITRHYSLLKRKTHPCRENGDIKGIPVPCKTIMQFCRENEIKHIDTLYIDTEGLDYEILLSIDFSAVEISNIIFEEWDHDDDDENGKYRTDSRLLCDVFAKLHNHGYRIRQYQQRDIQAVK